MQLPFKIIRLMERKAKSIQSRSLLVNPGLQPAIEIVLVYDDGSDIVTRWTPDEAYHHALAVIGCIEGAHTDAFLLALLNDRARMLNDFLEWRRRRE